MNSRRLSAPILISHDYDMSKQWYVYFRFKRLSDGKIVQKKVSNDYNRIKDRSERIKLFKALREAIEVMLADGWDPIEFPDFTKRPNKPLHNSFAGYKQMSIPDALQHALDKKTLAPKSRSDYKTTVGYVKDVCKELDYTFTPICELKRVSVKAIMDRMRSLKNLSNKGYNKHLTQLKSLLSELVEWEALEHNPAFRLKNMVEEETTKFETLTKQERVLVKEYLRQQNMGFFRFCMTIYHTGIRPKEILALRVKDVDFSTWTINLDPFGGKTKTKKQRQVAINDALRKLFMAVDLQNKPIDSYVFGQNFEPGEHSVSRATATTLWNKLIKDELGIDKYMYSLKHLGADDLIEAGADEDAVRDHLGHTSKFMTRRYTKKGKDRSREKILNVITSF